MSASSPDVRTPRARVVATSLTKRLLSICLLLMSVSIGANAAERLLFPNPLHITRRIVDPISGSTTTIDEYCYGNRVISVSGDVTAIADYEKGELTRIDRARSTYSVTRFDEIARSRGASHARLDAGTDEWTMRDGGTVSVAGGTGEQVEAERRDGEGSQSVRVVVDRSRRLSRAAAEVLLGAAYPNARDEVADRMLRALGPRRSERIASQSLAAPENHTDHGFPLEQIVRYEIAGETLEIRNSVTRIGSELPPPDKLEIPPGAKLVELQSITTTRMLEELDRLPAAPRP